jgi:hypothetical protein
MKYVSENKVKGLFFPGICFVEELIIYFKIVFLHFDLISNIRDFEVSII